MTEMAKISGMTPEEFTFIGMWVLWPPYILRPTTRLAYCTGTRRSPHVHKHNADNQSASTPTITSADAPRRERALAIKQTVDAGRDLAGEVGDDTDKDQQADMPLPMPFSVMRSPIHMVKRSTGRQRHKDQMRNQRSWRLRPLPSRRSPGPG